MLVLLYHAAVPGWDGGFVGVDVFYVLSGFLITGLLIREVARTGTISLPQFYARRARRLLPAALLTLAITVVASSLFLAPLQLPSVTGDAAWAALYGVNIHYALQATDYLQANQAPSPILHFWSLGVEEQFYVFWPAALLLIARARPDFRRRIGVTAAIVVVASFALSLWLTTASAPWAFFSLPTRAWELGIGALLAVATTRLEAIPARLAAIMLWVGVAMVALAGILFTTDTPFPGTAALLPTVGAGLVVAGGASGAATLPARLLGSAVPRFIGRISYSLYLWHWPLLVIPAAAIGSPLPLPARIGLALLAVPVAWATQRWVENPLRRGHFIGIRPHRNLALAAAMSLVVASVSFGVGNVAAGSLGDASGGPSAPAPAGDGLAGFLPPPASTAPAQTPARPGGTVVQSPTPASTPGGPTPRPPTPDGPLPANLLPSLAGVQSDQPIIYSDGCHLDQPTVNPGTCVYGLATGIPVVLFGDSHAAQWFPAIEQIAIQQGWRLISLTKSACPSMDMTVWNTTFKRVYTECDQWRSTAFRRIASERPALVIIANDRSQQPAVNGQPVANAAEVPLERAAIDRTIRRLTGGGASVVFIGDTPRAPNDPDTCLSKHPQSVLACDNTTSVALNPTWTAMEHAAAVSNGAEFIDPTPWVCPTSPCPAVIGRYLVYRDTHHLTTPFVTALASRLAALLPRLTR